MLRDAKRFLDSSVMFYMLPIQKRERSRNPPKKNSGGWLEQVDQAGDMGGEEIWEEEELVGVKRKRPMK